MAKTKCLGDCDNCIVKDKLKCLFFQKIKVVKEMLRVNE